MKGGRKPNKDAKLLCKLPVYFYHTYINHCVVTSQNDYSPKSSTETMPSAKRALQIFLE